ncbi:peptide ABC transporter substrate-binding protein [Microbacterium sp. Marseille-Q6965]|uniref:peptide ABC transporter substrate-binding protein n=1 Tax=Microbacterium sp. Marseille-Q6965 TaxID=2965072 RepID=UPI0021B776C5|nr:peptide ABC transporter substrate-binding protein [Microbacterium sp. Marseille-Q6965]
MRSATTARGRVGIAAAGLLATAALVAGCAAGGADGASGEPKDELNYALPANATPNWLMPLAISGKLATHNSSLIRALYEPLIAYDGSMGTVDRVPTADLADAVEFSEDGLSVTITLDERTWSDGTPVTSADVKFWFDVVAANKEDWASYRVGAMPDNVTAVETPDESTVVLTFDQVYNQEWLLASQLTLIVPIPAHAWAITEDGGEPDTALAETPEGAQAIWDYLIAEGEDLAGYEGNPLFDIVSGPYTLGAFSDSGRVTLTENDAYDGEDAAGIPTINFLPFTSGDAELAAVRSGEVDYGYIPTSELDNAAQYEDLGYDVVNWDGWSITYMPYNFNNPEMGPVYQQLYVRQALQHLVDQEQISEVVWHGAANPGYGPVPQNPDNKFLSDEQRENPYPFDPEAAQALLEENGWTLGSDGIYVCETGADCGEGIADGQKLAITILTQSGSTETDNMFAEMKSTFEEAGVGVTIESAPLNTVLGSIAPCEPDAAECTWELPFFGTAGSWYFGGYPSGERIFGTGAASNFGSYSDPEFDALMADSLRADDDTAMQEYSAYGAINLPVMWMPNPVYQVSVIDSGLTGTDQDSLGNFHPQRWAWSE